MSMKNEGNNMPNENVMKDDQRLSYLKNHPNLYKNARKLLETFKVLRYVTQQIQINHNQVVDSAMQLEAMLEYVRVKSEKYPSKLVFLSHNQIRELQRILTSQLQSLENISDVYTELQIDDEL